MENNKHVQKKIGKANPLTWILKQGKQLAKYRKKSGTELEVSEGQKLKESSELSNGLRYGEEETNKQKSSEIVKNVEADIFRIVTTEDGSFVALGNNRLTEYMSEKEAYARVMERDWELIFNVIATTAKAIIKTQNQKE